MDNASTRGHRRPGTHFDLIIFTVLIVYHIDEFLNIAQHEIAMTIVGLEEKKSVEFA